MYLTKQERFLIGHSVLKIHPICFLLAGQHSICLTNVAVSDARLLSKLFFRKIAASVQYFRSTAIGDTKIVLYTQYHFHLGSSLRNTGFVHKTNLNAKV